MLQVQISEYPPEDKLIVGCVNKLLDQDKRDFCIIIRPVITGFWGQKKDLPPI